MIALAATFVAFVAGAHIRAYVLLTSPRGRHIVPRPAPIEARILARFTPGAQT